MFSKVSRFRHFTVIIKNFLLGKMLQLTGVAKSNIRQIVLLLRFFNDKIARYFKVLLVFTHALLQLEPRSYSIGISATRN